MLRGFPAKSVNDSAIMSHPKVIIPSSLESHLYTDSGQQGADVRRALSMEEPSVGNLYSFDAELGQLKYAFKENGVAYNEKETSGLLCEATLELKASAPVSFTLEFEEGAVQRWGISFCGVVRVRHASGEVREVYLPGTRTYDPAGLTGELLCDVRQRMRGVILSSVRSSFLLSCSTQSDVPFHMWNVTRHSCNKS